MGTSTVFQTPEICGKAVGPRAVYRISVSGSDRLTKGKADRSTQNPAIVLTCLSSRKYAHVVGWFNRLRSRCCRDEKFGRQNCLEVNIWPRKVFKRGYFQTGSNFLPNPSPGVVSTSHRLAKTTQSVIGSVFQTRGARRIPLPGAFNEFDQDLNGIANNHSHWLLAASRCGPMRSSGPCRKEDLSIVNGGVLPPDFMSY